MGICLALLGNGRGMILWIVVLQYCTSCTGQRYKVQDVPGGAALQKQQKFATAHRPTNDVVGLDAS